MNKGKFDNDKSYHDTHGYHGGFINGCEVLLYEREYKFK